MSEQPVLTINSHDDDRRIPIEIDGTRYSIGLPSKLTIRSLKIVDRGQRRLQELDAKDEDLTVADEAEYSAWLVRMASQVCDAPTEVLSVMNDFKLIAILHAFSLHRADLSRQANGANPATATHGTTAPPTGTRSSSASRGSTKAPRRRTGGTARSKTPSLH